MEFLKSHYEKLILSVVLLGLALAAGYLPFEVANVRERLAEVTTAIEDGKVEPLKPLDLSTNEAVLRRVQARVDFDFGEGTHGLFNPAGTWRKGPGPGGFPPIPPAPSGVEGLTVTNITPLMLRVEFQGISQGSSAAFGMRYRFYIQNQASTNTALARGRIVILDTNDKPARPEAVLIKDIIGSPEDPDAFQLQLTDTRATIGVAKDKPYTEVAGYAADLRHDREGRTFLRQRPGSKLTIAGTAYNVVAISGTDVTIEDEKTKRRTVIPLKR